MWLCEWSIESCNVWFKIKLYLWKPFVHFSVKGVRLLTRILHHRKVIENIVLSRNILLKFKAHSYIRIFGVLRSSRLIFKYPNYHVTTYFNHLSLYSIMDLLLYSVLVIQYCFRFDISKMYHQILVDHDHRFYQFICCATLWNFLLNFTYQTLSYMVFIILLFLQFTTLNPLLNIEGHQMTLAAMVIIRDMYVDDVALCTNLQKKVKSKTVKILLWNICVHVNYLKKKL